VRESRTVLDLWWDFSPDELRQKGQDLAHALEKRDEMEIVEKGRREAFKGEWEEISGQVRMISSHIRRRGMLKPVACLIRFHHPLVGTKQIVREDTGEVVKEEPMSASECQEHLFERQPEEPRADAVAT
jgi:hypothetical protein